MNREGQYCILIADNVHGRAVLCKDSRQCTGKGIVYYIYYINCILYIHVLYIYIYSDNTAIVDLSNSIPHYIEEVERFTT